MLSGRVEVFHTYCASGLTIRAGRVAFITLLTVSLILGKRKLDEIGWKESLDEYMP